MGLVDDAWARIFAMCRSEDLRTFICVNRLCMLIVKRYMCTTRDRSISHGIEREDNSCGSANCGCTDDTYKCYYLNELRYSESHVSNVCDPHGVTKACHRYAPRSSKGDYHGPRVYISFMDVDYPAVTFEYYNDGTLVYGCCISGTHARKQWMVDHNKDRLFMPTCAGSGEGPVQPGKKPQAFGSGYLSLAELKAMKELVQFDSVGGTVQPPWVHDRYYWPTREVTGAASAHK